MVKDHSDSWRRNLLLQLHDEEMENPSVQAMGIDLVYIKLVEINMFFVFNL